MQHIFEKEGLGALAAYLQGIDGESLEKELSAREQTLGADEWEPLPSKAFAYSRIIWGSASLFGAEQKFLPQWQAITWLATLFEHGWLKEGEDPRKQLQNAAIAALRNADVRNIPNVEYFRPHLQGLLPSSISISEEEGKDIEERLNSLLTSLTILPHGKVPPAREMIEELFSRLVQSWKKWPEADVSAAWGFFSPQMLLMKIVLRQHHLPMLTSTPLQGQVEDALYQLSSGMIEGDPTTILRWIKDEHLSKRQKERVQKHREQYRTEIFV